MRKKIKDWLVKAPGVSGYSLWGVLHHPLEAFIFAPSRWIKHFIQRGWRGYADCDAWSLDYYLNKWMPKAVRSLKGGHGFPGGLFEELYSITYDDDHPYDHTRPNEEEGNKTHAYWQDILEKIALGFEAAYILEDDPSLWDKPRGEELKAQKKEGLALFIKYYDCLWD